MPIVCQSKAVHHEEKYELSRSNAAKRSSYRQQKNLRQQHRRLKMRLSNLKEKLQAMTKQCKGMKETTFEESLEGMPQKQREGSAPFFPSFQAKEHPGHGIHTKLDSRVSAHEDEEPKTVQLHEEEQNSSSTK
ncbi:hypothetical protein HPB49_026209 [Dermacentor silvarum]|nr:hypothetical protein HPB49_026209 [Dermacentor silvarum]